MSRLPGSEGDVASSAAGANDGWRGEERISVRGRRGVAGRADVPHAAVPGVAGGAAAGRSGAYWRDLVFGRLAPALFFGLFLARQLVLVHGGLHALRGFGDLLFLVQQALALAYFTMLIVLYTVRLPRRGTDHRAYVIFIAFSGTFAAIAASFLPGGTRRDALLPVADVLATLGLAYSVWGLAYLRRSFSIIPEARRLVSGGPYGVSRHPVYLGEVVTAIGVNLATAGWLSALAVAYFIACELLRIRWEERVLERAFPNDYPTYAGRVPRYLPNPFRR